jgi:hypothetical protein
VTLIHRRDPVRRMAGFCALQQGSRAGSTPRTGAFEDGRLPSLESRSAVDSNSSDADPASLCFGHRRRRWM